MGNNILYRGYQDGEPVMRREVFRPSLYTKDPKGQWRSLYNEPLRRHEFESMAAAKAFINERDGLSEAPVYGTTDYLAQYLQAKYPGTIDYDPEQLFVCPLDIEVDCDESPNELFRGDRADWPIDAITFRDRDGTYVCLTILGAEPDPQYLEGVSFISRQFATEASMLEAFVTLWASDYPDVVTGWNIRTFDIVYLINRITLVLGQSRAKDLSPWRVLELGGFTVKGQTRATYEMLGISQLDYQDLFKKFAYKYPAQESYKLNHIAHVVLDEQKISYEEYSGLAELREKNPGKYLAYNIKDTVLIQRLDDKLGLIDLVARVAYRAGVNYLDTMGTTKVWDTLIYRHLADRHVVVPPRLPAKSQTYEGAYVKEPKIGIHADVVSFDLASLYPNTIVEYNMSPETFVGRTVPGLGVKACLDGWTNDTDLSVAANGVAFRKATTGALPEIIIGLYEERQTVKRQMLALKREKEATPKEEIERRLFLDKQITRLANTEQAIKILLNSLYGAMGSAYFRYFNLQVAEAITISAQLAILTAERTVNDLMNRALGTTDVDYVIAIDTDSLYVNMDKLAAKCPASMNRTDFLDRFAKEVVQPAIAEAYVALHRRMGSKTPRMDMKREVIADRAFWIAKKRYVLNVLDVEGVRLAEPELKIMGIEAIKSSTPEVARDWMKEAFKMILANDQASFHAFIEGKRQEFYDLEPEAMAAPRGVSNVAKYSLRDGGVAGGTPEHSRAAVVYNRTLAEYGLQDRFPRIDDGDKIKYLHLKLPNPARDRVIGFPDVLPREFGLEPYINKALQFQKTFLDPLESICDAIGWSLEERSDLTSFI